MQEMMDEGISARGRVVQCGIDLTQAEYGPTASGQRPCDQTRFSSELQRTTNLKIKESLLFE